MSAVRNPKSPWRRNSTIIGRPTIPLAIVTPDPFDFATACDSLRQYTRGGMFQVRSQAELQGLCGVRRYVLAPQWDATGVTEEILSSLGYAPFNPEDRSQWT